MIDGKTPRRIWLNRALLIAAVGYGSYKICNSEQVRHALKMAKCLVNCGWKISEALSVAAELSAKALTDVKEFLEAEEDEMPASLVQLCKILSSKEVSRATSSIMAAAVDGIGRAGLREEENSDMHKLAVVDRLLVRVIDGLLSEKGKTLVSLAISVATRNAVRSMCNSLMHPDMVGRSAGVLVHSPTECGGDRVIRSFTTDVLNAAASSQGERILEVGISAFARSFVGACKESFSGANITNGFFSALAKPGNVEAIQSIAGAASREAMSSLVTASTSCLVNGPGIHTPTSVSANNFEVEGCSTTFLGSPGCKVYGLGKHDFHDLDTTGALPSKDPKCKELRVATKVSRVLDPLTNAVINFCKVPEARQLVVSVAGSVAKEGTKGIVMSVPELALSFWRIASSTGLCSIHSTNLVYTDKSTRLVILFCTLLYVSSNILVV